MGGVCLGRRAYRRNAIMAGRTIVHDAGMIEHPTDEGKREASGMTDATILICLYMGGCFTYGKRAIMTGSTVIYDARMIKSSWYKACGLVAYAAILSGWHMIRRRCFSSSGCTIVARGAVISNARMVKRGTSKSRGVMAHRAIITSQDVVESRTLLGYRSRRCITMARRAVIYDTGMIKHRWFKGTCYMTNTAIL